MAESDLWECLFAPAAMTRLLIQKAESARMKNLELEYLSGGKRANIALPSLLVLAQQKVSSIHFSSKSNEWATPQWLFDSLNREFRFTLDPCSTDENAKCKRHFTLAEDGLSQDWSEDVVFMNPPYGREIALWMEKAFLSSKNGATVVCLVPARTDTVWWHRYAIHGEIRFLKGRLKFGDATSSAPFPSAVIIFRPSGVMARNHSRPQ